ncbi:MAG: pyridoxamine 5'-phosphate oxidase family protein [Thermodesulfobacteriota bacterium]|nr:pyridoxamine 5'-phosphate oxidase family protein [Thermodesulfobacteriota bacterium]
MVKIPEEVVETLESDRKMCMMATVNEDNTINLVPIGSMKVIAEDKIAYACCFDGKTTNNLKEGRKKVAISLYKPMREGYQVKGVFLKMYDSGELFDEISATVNPMMEIMGVNGKVQSVATIKVTEVYALTIPIAGERMA